MKRLWVVGLERSDESAFRARCCVCVSWVLGGAAPSWVTPLLVCSYACWRSLSSRLVNKETIHPDVFCVALSATGASVCGGVLVGA